MIITAVRLRVRQIFSPIIYEFVSVAEVCIDDRGIFFFFVETPLTLAAGIVDNRQVLLALVAGGAHLDFRNMDGQTALHKAVFLPSHTNAKSLLELGASPNCQDPLGLTPLYYCMLNANSDANTAELLLRDYADVGVLDPHGNQEMHQVKRKFCMTRLFSGKFF